MNNRLRALLAGLLLTAAIVTGALAAVEDLTAPQGDTAWGAPDTTDGTASTLRDTAWG